MRMESDEFFRMINLSLYRSPNIVRVNIGDWGRQSAFILPDKGGYLYEDSGGVWIKIFEQVVKK